MEPADAQDSLSEPFLVRHLVALGLAVEYVRAEGNILYRRGADGAELPVLDLVGGFGATVLGHNHPELTRYAAELLDARTPVLAQFSLHPWADDVARKLNAVLHREFGTDEPYSVIFANSGAEAVEAAVKHAELDRVMRVEALRREVEDGVREARTAVRGGAALDPAARAALTAGSAGVAGGDGLQDAEALERLVREVAEADAPHWDAPPVFLAAEGAFHGKLVGSVQLTHNAAFRAPFRALAAPCRFAPLDRPGRLAELAREERRTVSALTVADGVVGVTARELPRVGAVVLEPVQGEGGIREVGPEFAAQAARTAEEAGCPVVVDEIQSGMGRTGAFFASSLVGLRGDYFVLAKGLGGGLAKAAALLVRQSRYRPEFEMAHSSTFAKDGFSTRLAGRVLDLLEADGGALYRLARDTGERLTARLEGVRNDFKDVVKDVRGRGLMLGVEFHDPAAAGPPALQEHVRAGTFGYVLSGYLLREHAVRVFPTASATSTLRIEPSVHLSEAEMDQAESALRGLCRVLRDGDGDRLLAG